MTAYIDAAAEPARTRLRTLRAIVRKLAPAAVERMAYGLPTWHQEENLIHLGAFARHVGVYPGPAAIEAFADELASFSTSKGAIQLPHDRDLPVDLVRRIVRWRLEQVAARRRSDQRPSREISGRAAPAARAAPRAGKPRRPGAAAGPAPKRGPKARR